MGVILRILYKLCLRMRRDSRSRRRRIIGASAPSSVRVAMIDLRVTCPFSLCGSTGCGGTTKRLLHPTRHGEKRASDSLATGRREAFEGQSHIASLCPSRRLTGQASRDTVKHRRGSQGHSSQRSGYRTTRGFSSLQRSEWAPSTHDCRRCIGMVRPLKPMGAPPRRQE